MCCGPTYTPSCSLSNLMCLANHKRTRVWRRSMIQTAFQNQEYTTVQVQLNNDMPNLQINTANETPHGAFQQINVDPGTLHHQLTFQHMSPQILGFPHPNLFVRESPLPVGGIQNRLELPCLNSYPALTKKHNQIHWRSGQSLHSLHSKTQLSNPAIERNRPHNHPGDQFCLNPKAHETIEFCPLNVQSLAWHGLLLLPQGGFSAQVCSTQPLPS